VQVRVIDDDIPVDVVAPMKRYVQK